jgi:hypothetical protein
MLAAALLLAVWGPPLQKDGPKDRVSIQFVDFAEELGKPDTVVVVGRLPKVTEGHRERMKDEEGDLGEGGTNIKMSGTTFYRVASTARLQVVKGLHGVGKDPTLALAFDAQVARLDRGGARRHFLVKPRVRCEDGMLGLFVLRKDKAGLDVVQVVRFERSGEAVPADVEAAFLKRAEDLFLINQRLHELRAALDEATFQKERGERKAGANRLRAVLDKSVKMLSEEDQGLLNAHVGPLEKRARDLLKELDPDSGR